MEENDYTKKILCGCILGKFMWQNVSLRGCKWLGHFNTRGVIQDIKRVNADAKSSTTTVKFQEWMPIRGLIRYKQQGK